VLASRLMTPETESKNAIEEAFLRILCRPMSSKESKLLMSYYDDQLERFQSNPSQVKESLEVGEYPLEEKHINAKTAALMQVIVSLYNLEETITKI
nr:hypothetical protein [Algoriphagus sp.]